MVNVQQMVVLLIYASQVVLEENRAIVRVMKYCGLNCNDMPYQMASLIKGANVSA